MGGMKLPRLLRPRFSLLTLFAVITLCEIWCAWETAIVRHRLALLDRLKASGGVWIGSDGGVSAATRRSAQEHPASVSLVRRLLGDDGICVMSLPHSMAGDKQQFTAAFPETDVRVEEEEADFGN